MAKGGEGVKKIAVIITDRHGEALRMSVGLTLADDEVSVYLLGARLPGDVDASMNLEALSLMGASLYTDTAGNPGELMTTREAALALKDYDAVVSY